MCRYACVCARECVPPPPPPHIASHFVAPEIVVRIYESVVARHVNVVRHEWHCHKHRQTMYIYVHTYSLASNATAGIAECLSFQFRWLSSANAWLPLTRQCLSLPTCSDYYFLYPHPLSVIGGLCALLVFAWRFYAWICECDFSAFSFILWKYFFLLKMLKLRSCT